MILPYNTDAPIYHFPYVTIGLIAVNTLVFVATAQMEPDQVEPWILIFGDGLHPLQWLTTNFLHAGFWHLLGNMFYLWGFGLVVEGKLGWWRMLVVYLVIGIVYGALIQTMMLGSEGGAVGASGVIFGLMAISLVWAPRNEMSCFMWLITPTTVDVSIVFFSTSYLAWQLFVAWLTGFGMSSEMLHLTGAGLGAVVGVALLKFGIVDCEGWDLFAVWKGTEGSTIENDRSQRKLPEKAAPPDEPKPAGTIQLPMFGADVKNRLLGGDVPGAASVYATHRKSHPEWTMEEPDLMALMRTLHEQKLWAASIPPMVDYIRQFPERSVRIRLKLAQILIASERRPMKAIEVLSKVSPEALSADLQATRQKLLSRAEQMKSECEIEVADGEDW